MKSSERIRLPEPSWALGLWWRLRCWLGFGSVWDGSICWVSKRLATKTRAWEIVPIHPFDPHDYHKHKGGDGIPSHFYVYACHRCGRRFGI